MIHFKRWITSSSTLLLRCYYLYYGLLQNFFYGKTTECELPAFLLVVPHKPVCCAYIRKFVVAWFFDFCFSETPCFSDGSTSRRCRNPRGSSTLCAAGSEGHRCARQRLLQRWAAAVLLPRKGLCKLDKPPRPSACAPHTLP